MTGGWPLPASGGCRWPSACCLGAGSSLSVRRSGPSAPLCGVSDGMQEALENVREIRATNQEERYLAGLYRKIDEHEQIMIRGELVTGLFVNGASVIMRLGVATTILTGAGLILSGQIDFMLLFLFLMVITRIYAPLRSEPCADCRAVCLPGVGRPDERSVRHAHRRRGGNLPAQGTRHCL